MSEAQPRQPLRSHLVAGGVDIGLVKTAKARRLQGEGEAANGGIQQTVMLVGGSTRGPRQLI